MSRQPEFPNPYCPAFQETLEVIGRRWTGSILRALFSGCQRFGEIRAVVPGLSPRLLTQRLSELEAKGLVSHQGDRYRLTERGRDLKATLLSLERWNRRWQPTISQS